MPQNLGSGFIARILGTTQQVQVAADNNNVLLAASGVSSALNQTAAGVIKASKGRVATITIIAPGTTSGAFTLNDCATTGAAAAGNVIWSMAYNSSLNVAGAVFKLDWPCTTGIVLSAVPGGGSPVIAISYT